jgi:hypothetical protein
LIIDGRNLLLPEKVTAHGFQYVGIGGISAVPNMTPPLAAFDSCTILT